MLVLARPQSQGKVPSGAEVVVGDPLDARSLADAVRRGDTLVQLVGTPHPNPSKADEFTRTDLGLGPGPVGVAARAGVAHFVYVRVATLRQ